jgi:hypothetical protein
MTAMPEILITEGNCGAPGHSEFYDAAAGGAVVEKIFLEIIEPLIVFRVAFFQFLIEKMAERSFPVFALNNTVTDCGVAL